jgi:uncharacterized protein (TIGR02246 family)
MWRLVLQLIFCAVFITSCDRSQNSSEKSAEIGSFFEQYVSAFNRHDANAMSEQWSENGHRIHPRTGEVAEGRAAIKEALQKMFEEGKADQLQVKILKSSAPEEGVIEAIGRFRVTFSDGKPPRESAVRVLLVNEDGGWKIDEVREIAADAPKSQEEHLKGLEFLLGSWEDQDEDVTIKNKARYDRYRNFIIQKFEVQVYNQLLVDGYQIIGWDPIKKHIHSWMFDSDGGFGEGIWKMKDNQWYVDSHFTLSDGRRASATYIYKPIDANSYSWAAENRDIGGELLPNVEPVTVVKVAEEKKS